MTSRNRVLVVGELWPRCHKPLCSSHLLWAKRYRYQPSGPSTSLADTSHEVTIEEDTLRCPPLTACTLCDVRRGHGILKFPITIAICGDSPPTSSYKQTHAQKFWSSTLTACHSDVRVTEDTSKVSTQVSIELNCSILTELGRRLCVNRAACTANSAWPFLYAPILCA